MTALLLYTSQVAPKKISGPLTTRFRPLGDANHQRKQTKLRRDAHSVRTIPYAQKAIPLLCGFGGCYLTKKQGDGFYVVTVARMNYQSSGDRHITLCPPEAEESWKD